MSVSRGDPWQCFDSPAAWLVYLRGGGNTRGEPCRDCCPSYQAEMLEAGRCRYPETTFRTNANGELVGSRWHTLTAHARQHIRHTRSGNPYPVREACEH